MSTDYFAKIDKAVKAHDDGEAEKQRDEETRKQYTREVIVQVLPLLERYKEQLAQRGIDAEIFVGGYQRDHLTFELKYTHGGHYGFELHNGNYCRKFTEDGRHYCDNDRTGTPLRKPFDVSAFESTLQRVIDDFMLHAPKNGGFLRRPR